MLVAASAMAQKLAWLGQLSVFLGCTRLPIQRQMLDKMKTIALNGNELCQGVRTHDLKRDGKVLRVKLCGVVQAAGGS